jgi:Tol biopolymer transport system component
VGQPSYQTDLYVIGADGTGLRQLTALSFVYGPVFSPDGSEILFAYSGDGTSLFRTTPSAQPYDEVMTTPYFSFPFTVDDGGWDWSPDGTEIVVTDPDLSQGDLVIVKIKSATTSATYTSDRVLIGRTGGAAAVTDRQPSWRP